MRIMRGVFCPLKQHFGARGRLPHVENPYFLHMSQSTMCHIAVTVGGKRYLNMSPGAVHSILWLTFKGVHICTSSLLGLGTSHLYNGPLMPCRFSHLSHYIWQNEQSLSVAVVIWWMNQSVLWRVSINVKAGRSWNQQTDGEPSITQEKEPE